MKSPWGRSVLPIALIFSFRMLGLFMLIPVFSVLAINLDHATPVLIGVALGAYGLSQALLQIPFGMLSDRFGRKSIITVGLCLFAIGSLVGALSHSIYGMIFARTIQGMGAIGSVLIALSADLTADENRTKGMALIGMTIGISFAVAMIISPIITRLSGLAGIFYISVLLAIGGLLLLWLVIPTPKREVFHIDSGTRVSMLSKVLTMRSLLQLNTSIFIQHCLLTTTFFAVPILLHHPVDSGRQIESWYFYLPIMVVAFVLMIPLIILAENKNKMKGVMIGSVAALMISQLLLTYYSQLFICLTLLITIYFTGFNVLEACLPSLISKHAPVKNKGTAMGVYSSFQFLGIFAGGLLAGVLYKYFNTTGIFYFNSLLCLLWLIVIRSFEPASYVSTALLELPQRTDIESFRSKILAIPGVRELYIAPAEQLLYVKYNKRQLDMSVLLSTVAKTGERQSDDGKDYE